MGARLSSGLQPWVGWWICALASLSLASCRDSEVTDAYKKGLITADQTTLTRVEAGESSLFFIDMDLSSHVECSINNFHELALTAGETSVLFDLMPRITRGCTEPDPWDIPPEGTKAVRMRADLRNEQAELLIACEFEPTELGFNYATSQTFGGARTGPAIPADSAETVKLELRATTNCPCTEDDCRWHALVEAEGRIGGP